AATLPDKSFATVRMQAARRAADLPDGLELAQATTRPHHRFVNVEFGRTAMRSLATSQCLTATPNQRFPSVHPALATRGVSRSSRTLERDAVDAAASGA